MTAPDMIENRTYDEIGPGDRACLTRTLTPEDIQLFAVVTGDVNPAHVDPEYAATDIFHKVIAHGMWGSGLISAVLGTELPGPGTIYLEQELRFRNPVTLGDTITATVIVTAKDDRRHCLTFDCRCTNQHGEDVITGEAKVIAPMEKVKRPRMTLPEVRLASHARYRALWHRPEVVILPPPPLPIHVMQPPCRLRCKPPRPGSSRPF